MGEGTEQVRDAAQEGVVTLYNCFNGGNKEW